ncbi:MAG: hypothetical protein KJ747_10740 [Actinobacteria bacterium]|nr:hypothetical protein [Actinomycetota bacterium]MCG2808250.1 hypothetical protein [Coriobacteriia bacterium]
MSSTVSRSRLLSAVLGLLWAQWTELGVAGTRGSQAAVIDPEALLLATTRFGTYDPRLFDEVLDWLTRFSDRLDVTRLRRMSRGVHFHDAKVTATVVEFMRVYGSEQKWSGTADVIVAREEAVTYGARVLFTGVDGTPLPVPGVVDEFFASRGLARPTLELRGMSVPPNVRSRALTRLRLRTLVGLGVRAEALLYLSTHDHAHGRLVAARSGYGQKQVADYLAAMANDGLAIAWAEGRTVQYRLAAPIGTTPGAGQYVDWIAAFDLIALLWSSIAEAASEATSYSASKRLRAGLEAVSDRMPVEGLALDWPQPGNYPGESAIKHAEEFAGLLADALTSLSR